MPLIIAYWLLEFLVWMILLGSILTWFPAARKHGFTKLVHSITNPLLMPFRALLPTFGGIDFSPLLAILFLMFLRGLLRQA
ncbi:MAG: YggT family protein [Holophagaceae bacterium]|nr:YggT family protein [Holophagaceae bacterium]